MFNFVKQIPGSYVTPSLYLGDIILQGKTKELGNVDINFLYIFSLRHSKYTTTGNSSPVCPPSITLSRAICRNSRTMSKITENKQKQNVPKILPQSWLEEQHFSPEAQLDC